MSEIEYIGKCLLIDKRVLVIGDLHLGYSGAMRESGVLVPSDLFEETIRDLDEIFEKINNDKKNNYGKKLIGEDGGNVSEEVKNGLGNGAIVEKVVLLGDLKHEFGKFSDGEWKEIGEMMNYLRRKCDEVIVVKGNHDVIAGSVVDGLDRVEFVDYYLWNGFGFMHGDKDFPEIHSKDVKNWIIGHGHPAVNLQDGVKKEKYKCFLVGKFKGRKVIIVPSFFVLNEGSDARDYDLGLAWDFKLSGFGVKVVGDGLEALEFGKLLRIRDL